MPRKAQTSAAVQESNALNAPKSANFRSNPLPPSLQSPPPGPDSAKPRMVEEWMAENARAKAIIMSSLVPGSEPWQIAEPLEYATDIWSALEDKYGLKDHDGRFRDWDDENESDQDVQRGEEQDDVTSEGDVADTSERWHAEIATGRQRQRQRPRRAQSQPQPPLSPISPSPLSPPQPTPPPPPSSASNDMSDSHQEKSEPQAQDEQQAEAEVTTGSGKGSHSPLWSDKTMRDQRFLWALLHGGKDHQELRHLNNRRAELLKFLMS